MASCSHSAPEATHFLHNLSGSFISNHHQTAIRLPYETSHFSYVTSFASGVLSVFSRMHGCFTPLKSVGGTASHLPPVQESLKLNTILPIYKVPSGCGL